MIYRRGANKFQRQAYKSSRLVNTSQTVKFIIHKIRQSRRRGRGGFYPGARRSRSRGPVAYNNLVVKRRGGRREPGIDKCIEGKFENIYVYPAAAALIYASRTRSSAADGLHYF